MHFSEHILKQHMTTYHLQQPLKSIRFLETILVMVITNLNEDNYKILFIEFKPDP